MFSQVFPSEELLAGANCTRESHCLSKLCSSAIKKTFALPFFMFWYKGVLNGLQTWRPTN